MTEETNALHLSVYEISRDDILQGEKPELDDVVVKPKLADKRQFIERGFIEEFLHTAFYDLADAFATIDQLRLDLEDADERIRELEAIQSEDAAVISGYDKLDTRAENAIRTLDELESTVREFANAHEENKERIQTLESENAAMSTNLETAKVERDRAREEATRYETEATGMREDVAILAEDVNGLLGAIEMELVDAGLIAPEATPA